MTLQTLVINNTSLEDFITFWSVQYDYPLEHLYNDNIVLTSLSLQNIQDLFLWKNGMRLSDKKEISLNKIIESIDVINELKQSFVPDLFEQNFGNMTAIWKIFLLHIICPDEFPIFDQHVYRAYQRMSGFTNEPLPGNKIKKAGIYFDQYRPFYNELRQQAFNFSNKVIDEALWAYGRFLSIHPRML